MCLNFLIWLHRICGEENDSAVDHKNGTEEVRQNNERIKFNQLVVSSFIHPFLCQDLVKSRT